MMFAVIFIVLLIERFFDWGHLRYWDWFPEYQRLVQKKLPKVRHDIIFALTVLSLVIALLWIEFLIGNVLYGFIQLLFQIIVLLYCLGPRNFWVDAFNAMSTVDEKQKSTLLESAKKNHHLTDYNANELAARSFFIEANCRVFAVLFWYMVLGPVGALLYRLISYRARNVTDQTDRQDLHQAEIAISILDWLPIRALIIVFALGGHFVQVFSYWHKHLSMNLSENEILLAGAGFAALGIDTEHAKVHPKEYLVENSAIYLVDRALVIVLIIAVIISTVL